MITGSGRRRNRNLQCFERLRVSRDKLKRISLDARLVDRYDGVDSPRKFIHRVRGQFPQNCFLLTRAAGDVRAQLSG
jgi:hypothetical protein